MPEQEPKPEVVDQAAESWTWLIEAAVGVLLLIGTGVHCGPHRRNSGPVPRDARQVAAARPAPVAVHDDGDVSWEPRRIKPVINVRFLAIQPGRNCRLQANLCCLLTLT